MSIDSILVQFKKDKNITNIFFDATEAFTERHKHTLIINEVYYDLFYQEYTYVNFINIIEFIMKKHCTNISTFYILSIVKMTQKSFKLAITRIEDESKTNQNNN